MQGRHSQRAMEGELTGGLPRKRLTPSQTPGRDHSTGPWSGGAGGCAVKMGPSKREGQGGEGAQREGRGLVGSLKGREDLGERVLKCAQLETQALPPSLPAGFLLAALPHSSLWPSGLLPAGPDHTTWALSTQGLRELRDRRSRLDPL